MHQARPIWHTKVSDRKYENVDIIVIFQTDSEAGRCSIELVSGNGRYWTMNINNNVDQQDRLPNIRQWRFPILETLFLQASFKNENLENQKSHFLEISQIWLEYVTVCTVIYI